MSTPSTQAIRQFRGRLIADPSNIDLAAPYGGTYLGIVRAAVFEPRIRTREILAEEYGNTPVEAIYAGQSPVFLAVLRGLDGDMIPKVFPSASLGSISQTDPLIQDNATSDAGRAGQLLSTKTFKLLFAPDAENWDPFIVVYKALPLVQEAAQMQFALSTELGIAVAFMGLPDNSKGGKRYEMGARKDIAL